MKKISIMFIFFTIFMCLFIGAKVYAATPIYSKIETYTTDKEMNKINEDDVRIVVCQEDLYRVIDIGENQGYGGTFNNAKYENGKYVANKADISVNDVQFMANSEHIAFLWATEERFVSIKAIDKLEIEVDGSKIETNDDNFRQGENKSGINGYWCVFYLNTHNLSNGEHSVKFYVQSGAKNTAEGIHCEVTVKFNVANEASGLGSGTEEKPKITNNDVSVIVSQNAFNGINQYRRDWTYTDANQGGNLGTIDVDNAKFDEKQNIEVSINTKEGGLSGDCSIEVYEGSTHIKTLNNTNNADISQPEYCLIDKEGTNSLKTKVLLKLTTGDHTIKFILKGEQVNFEVSITFHVTDNFIDNSAILNIENRNAESQSKLNSGEIRVVIATKSGIQVDRIYKDMKDYRKKSIDATKAKIHSMEKVEIYVYYERSGLNLGGTNTATMNSSGLPLDVIIDPATDCGPGPNGNDGNNAFYFRALVILKGSCTIPFKMKTQQTDSAFNEFDININIDVSENFNDGRNPGFFEDVLTNLGWYKPSGGSNDGVAELETKIGTVLSVITNLGMILSVLISAILGVKYMLASVEEKAEIKSDMIPYLIGACLVFGVCIFVKILQSVGNSFNT